MSSERSKSSVDHRMCIQIKDHMYKIKKMQRNAIRKFKLKGIVPSPALTDLAENASNIYMDLVDEIIKMRLLTKKQSSSSYQSKAFGADLFGSFAPRTMDFED
jgi:hypothetical protein